LGALAALGCLVVALVAAAQPSGDRAASSDSATLEGSPVASLRCPYVPLMSVLATSNLAVSGTVINLTDQAVVVQIDHVYRGDPKLQRVTIRRGTGVADSFRTSSLWSKGDRQLVAAKDGAVIECVGGATAPWSQEEADRYQEALK
jgi:hypothetical protein